MPNIIRILNILSALACALPFVLGSFLAYWGLLGLEHGDYSAIALGIGISTASVAAWAVAAWGSSRLRERRRTIAALVAVAPFIIVAAVALVVLASSHGSKAPLATAHARPKVSRPLWQACAYALDMNSHLSVEKLTSLIESGKVGGPDLEQAYKDRGCIHESSADDALAVADYAKALALDPNDAEVYFIRGRTHGNARQYPQALADYDSALRFAPDDSETYYRRGHLFEDAMHEHSKAVADYNSSIRLDPNNPAAYEMRAVAYANLGRHEEAAADRETATRLRASPSSPISAKRAAGEWE